MIPRFEQMPQRVLVGMRTTMSLADDKTSDLWRRFMPRRREIAGRLREELYSVQVYGAEQDIDSFTPQTFFEKWAAVAVSGTGAVPDEMESLILPGGLYAVFIHRGPWRTFPQTFQQIFGVWLPDSGYRLDNRPHFDLMQEGYDPNDERAEEEIWIPVRAR